MPAAESIGGASAGTITTIPTPMLKVRHISSRWMPPAFWSASKIARNGPCGTVDGGGKALGEHPGHVVDHAAAGDVGHGVDVGPGAHVADGVEVGAMRLEEEIDQRLVGTRQHVRPLQLVLGDDVPHQRVPVGVQPAARQRVELVAGLRHRCRR